MSERREHFCFRPRHRLRKTSQFQFVRREGTRVVTRLLILYLRHNDEGESRIGVVASKKVGNAVVRNRCKRLMREVFRRTRPQWETPLDVVVIVKRKREYPGYQAYERDFTKGLAHFRERCSVAG